MEPKIENIKKPEIRKLEIEDAEKLLAFFRKLVVVDPERVENIADVENLTLKMEEDWIKERIKKEEEGNIVVRITEKDGKIIAEGEVERMKRWIENHLAEIRFGMLPNNDEEALALVQTLSDEAKNIGIEVLQYYHLATQKTGIEIMRQSGFSEFGRAKKHYKRGDEYVDRVYMEKIL